MENYCDTVMSTLNEYRHDGQFCDVKISVNEQIFNCHKSVLVATTEYFRKMFSGKFEESNSDIITINNCDQITFSHFLEFIYTGNVTIDITIVVKLRLLSSYLLVERLSNKCDLFIQQCLNEKVENALLLLLDSIEIGLEEKEDMFIEFLQLHFNEIYENELIYQIPHIQFQKLTSKCRSKCMFNTIINWIAHDKSRLQYMNVLLEGMRLQYIRNKIELLNISESSNIEEIKQITPIWLNAVTLTNHFYSSSEIQIFGINQKSEFIVSQKYTNNNLIESITYNKTQELKADQFVITRLKYHTYIQYHDLTSANYSFKMFDNAFGENWVPCNTVNSKFSKLVSCDNMNRIYGYGHTYDEEAFNFCMYIPDTDKWENIKKFSLSDDIICVGVNFFLEQKIELIVHDNNIYAFGLSQTNLNFFERYDLRTGFWEPLPIPASTIISCSATVLGNNTYVSGIVVNEEEYEERKVNVLYSYDMVAGKWNTDYTGMVYTRHGKAYSLLTFQNKLYAIGDNPVIEIYDPEGNFWKNSTSIDANMECVSTIVL